MSIIDRRNARMGLAALGPAGCPELRGLIADEGPIGAWLLLTRGDAEGWPLARRAQEIDLEAVAAETVHLGTRFIIPGDDEWPERLDDLYGHALDEVGGAPLGLWVRGCQLHREPVVAIAGSRASTAYGDRVATELAANMTDAGAIIVTGASFGVEGSALRGSLAADDRLGRVVAVMAGGLDLLYPRAHAPLLEEVAAQGTIISEQALGVPPSRRSFQQRTRLIAALTAGVVVVEAGMRSGARNTAAWATELGRPVMAVPGPVTSTTSMLPHQLIRSGAATLVTDHLDVIAVLGDDLTSKEAAA